MAFILVVLLTLAHLGVSADSDVQFGGCQPDNQTCSKCYHKLKESLLKRDNNVRSLSTTFFPPKDNLPEFVTVTYCFNEICNKTKKWYWTRESSYLFFPLKTFQYLSLFFGKPAEFFSRDVTLTLDEECYINNTNDNPDYDQMLTLLTQRLKNFIQRASFDPVIDDNYFARAEENDQDDLSTPRARYILSFNAIGLVFALIIAIALLLIYLNTKRWDKKLKNTVETKKSNKYTQSKIFSIAATTFFVNVYALILDSIALYTIVNEHVIINEHYLNALPYYIFAIDVVGALFWMGCWIASLCSYCLDIKKEYICLALSTLGPTFSLVIHIPYIAIAYLNDASYATSIFIYYTITLFVLFGTLDLTYGACQGAIINVNNRDQEEGLYHCCPKTETQRRYMFIVIIPLFTLLILVFAGMITAALVIIPISKAFSDVPNRLLGFYQTAIILVGAYLVYHNFFKKKPSLHSVVKEREEFIPTNTVDDPAKWDQLSKDERVEQFYTRFVDIIAHYPIGEQTAGVGRGAEGGGAGGATSQPQNKKAAGKGDDKSPLMEQ